MKKSCKQMGNLLTLCLTYERSTDKKTTETIQNKYVTRLADTKLTSNISMSL